MSVPILFRIMRDVWYGQLCLLPRTPEDGHSLDGSLQGVALLKRKKFPPSKTVRLIAVISSDERSTMPVWFCEASLI
jgi:hypothetical protein